MKRFSISVGEPWDFEGPEGRNILLVELLGVVGWPKQMNWASHALLLRSITPFDMDGERVELMVATPRYVGENIELVATAGGTVNVARVRPNCTLMPGGSYNTTDVTFCIIGDLTPISTDSNSQLFHPSFGARFWSGKAPLWQAFWFCGVAGAIATLIVLSHLGSALSHIGLNHTISSLLLISIVLGYSAFASVSIWRCAGNGEVSSLGALAKVYAVMSLIVWIILMFIGFTFQE